MEEKFDLVTGLNLEEIDADHYLFEIDGVPSGSVDLDRWGWFSKVVKTVGAVAGIVRIWV